MHHHSRLDSSHPRAVPWACKPACTPSAPVASFHELMVTDTWSEAS